MKFTPHLIVVVFSIFGYLLYQYVSGGPGNLIELKSELDGNVYRVQDLPNKQDACEMLATVKANMDKVRNFYSQEEFESDVPAKLLVARYNPQNIMENSMTSGDTSYSENKGEKIVLCLRDKDAPPKYPLVDINTVMFVVLHELAHLMTAELSTGSHTREFWSNFRRLLEDTSKLGIYTPVNYSKTPVPYCGMTITDSPL